MRWNACELIDPHQPCGAETNMAKYLAAKASWENSQKIGRLEALLSDFIVQFRMHCDRVEAEIARNARNDGPRSHLSEPLSQRSAGPPSQSAQTISAQ